MTGNKSYWPNFQMGIQVYDENDNPFYDESYISVITKTDVKTWNKTTNLYDTLEITY